MSDFNIYVASLSDYNAGRLVGTWIDCTNKNANDIYSEIQDMLATSTEFNAEEWAIHDTDCPIDLDEYASIESIVRICNLFNEHNEDVVNAAFNYYGNDLDTIEGVLSDNEYSYYESKDELMEQWMESREIPENVRFYIDEDKVWCDMQIEGTFVELTGNGPIVEFYS